RDSFLTQEPELSSYLRGPNLLEIMRRKTDPDKPVRKQRQGCILLPFRFFRISSTPTKSINPSLPMSLWPSNPVRRNRNSVPELPGILRNPVKTPRWFPTCTSQKPL